MLDQTFMVSFGSSGIVKKQDNFRFVTWEEVFIVSLIILQRIFSRVRLENLMCTLFRSGASFYIKNLYMKAIPSISKKNNDIKTFSVFTLHIFSNCF